MEKVTIQKVCDQRVCPTNKLMLISGLCFLFSLGCDDDPANIVDNGSKGLFGGDSDSDSDSDSDGDSDSDSDGDSGDPDSFDDGQDECDQDTTVFDHAVCVCEDMLNWGNGLNTHTLFGFGKKRGHVGVNGDVDIKGNMVIDGNFDIGGRYGNMGNVVVNKDMFVGDNSLIAGVNKVYEDAYFGGNLAGAGVLSVSKSLSVSKRFLFLGAITYRSIKKKAPFQSHDPCACGDDDIIDVKAMVASKRNAPEITLPEGIGNQGHVITAGDYYSNDGSAFIGNYFVIIDGAVKLYIEDDVRMIGNGKFKLLPGATLDIYISGSLKSIGNFHMGDSVFGTDADAIRLYVGGGGVIGLVGNQGFSGGIYAPRAYFDYTGNLRVLGSLFVRSLIGKGNLTVHYNGGLIDEDCDDYYDSDADGDNGDGDNGDGDNGDGDNGDGDNGDGDNDDGDNGSGGSGDSGDSGGSGGGSGNDPHIPI